MHRSLRTLVGCCFAFCFVGGLAGQDGTEPRWPLPEHHFPVLKTLLDEATQQSPRMVARNTEEAVAEANRIVVRAAQLPAASGFYNYYPWYRDERVTQVGSGTEATTTYESQRSMYGVAVVQPIYHWNALKNGTRIAELQKAIVRNQTAEVYRLMVGEVRALFLQLVIKKSGLARSRFALEQARSSLALAKQNFDNGLISATGMFPPTIGLEQAELATDRLQEDYDASRLVLGKLCGVAPLRDEQIPDSIPDFALPGERLEAVLAKHTGEEPPESSALKIVEQQIEIEKLNYRIAQTRLRPKLNLQVGTSQDQQSYTAALTDRYGVTSLYAGVQVSWSMFDGFATRATKVAALARRRQLERTRRELSADLIEQARGKLRQVEFAARGLGIATQLFNVAAGGVAGAREDLSRGLISETDLRAVEFNHAGSQIEIYNARYEYLMRLSDFLSTLHEDPALENLPALTR